MRKSSVMQASSEGTPVRPALLWLACTLALLLQGCDTIAPVRVQYVNVEVPVKCAAGARPVAPVNKYGSLPAGTGVDYALEALKGDSAAWERYGTDMAAKTAGCWE